MILAGDIGGTKTHLALFEAKEERHWIVDQKFRSQDYKNLLEIVKEFVSSQKEKIVFACLGIAGPVREGKCYATNLPWIVDAEKISQGLGITNVWLINDLEANAFGIRCLLPEEFYVLNVGKEEIRSNKALISAGTGLGEAGIFWDGKQHLPFATEGGHSSFAPENELESELLYYLRKKYQHVSYERILSGPGLYNIYRFLIEMGLEKEDPAVKKQMQVKDPPRVITEMAKQKACSACQRALQLFVSIYGSEAGNLALKMLSLGGLYVGGGIAPKILQEMKEGPFFERFISKGRFTPFLKEIPVKVILNENTALLGAAQYVRERI